MIDPDALMTYLDFVNERHRIWGQRQAGAPQPWTDDPILERRKFTNMFRVLDPGSQFVFELAQPEDDPHDVLMRLFLYRYTNRPETWRHIREQLGSWPSIENLHLVADVIKDYRDAGNQVFSGAYMILPQPNVKGGKVDQAVELAQRLFVGGTAFPDFMASQTQVQRFDVLRRYYGVGDFMAMQVLTDWGYTPQCGEDRENEFVIQGPGSLRGARAIDSSAPPLETLRYCWDLLQTQGPTLGGRSLSLMDVQNTLCEFSKYVRYAAKGAQPGTSYRPAHPGPQPAPVLPTSWN